MSLFGLNKDISKKSGNPQKEPVKFDNIDKNGVMKYFDNLGKDLENITLDNKTWGFHKNMYVNNILPISNQEFTKDINGQKHKIYKFKYDKDIFEHKFFKQFLISLVSVNRHTIKSDDKVKINITIDDIGKKFNGFTTLECIFNNESALEKSYNNYVNADKALIAQLDKTFEIGAKQIMMDIIKQFCRMQVLSYIELCDVKSHNIRIGTIEKIIKEQIPTKDGTPYIPADILKTILEKIKLVNDHNSLNFGELEDFEKQKKPVVYRSDKDIVYDGIVYDEKISKILNEVPKKEEPKKEEPKQLPQNPSLKKYQDELDKIIKTIPSFTEINNTVVTKLKEHLVEDNVDTTEVTKKLYENRDTRSKALLKDPLNSKTVNDYLKILKEAYDNINARKKPGMGNPVYNFAIELNKIHDNLETIQKAIDSGKEDDIKKNFDELIKNINNSIKYIKDPVTVIKGGEDKYKHKYLKYKAKYLQTKL